MTDLVERLREHALAWSQKDYSEAADEIERLRAELFRFAEVNKQLALPWQQARSDALEEAAKVAEQPVFGKWAVQQPHIATAIRALKEKP